MTPCSEALGISAFAASLDTPRIRSFGLVARVLARVQRCRAAVIRRIYVLRDRALLRIVDVTTGTGCESCRRADDKRHPVPLGHHVLLQGDCVARSHSFRCEAGRTLCVSIRDAETAIVSARPSRPQSKDMRPSWDPPAGAGSENR